MNKREAKHRAIKLCIAVIGAHLDDGSFRDMVDDDTSDDETDVIIDAIDAIKCGLQNRSDRLDAAQHRLQSDVCQHGHYFNDPQKPGFCLDHCSKCGTRR